MNLGINKQEAEFLEHTILYFLKSSKLPDLLMDMYPGVNVKDILSQLQYIKQLGEDAAGLKEIKEKFNLE